MVSCDSLQALKVLGSFDFSNAKRRDDVIVGTSYYNSQLSSLNEERH